MVDVRMVTIVMIFVMDLMFDLRTNSKVGDGLGPEHDDGCDDDDDEDGKDHDHDDGDGWRCWCWWAGACYWLVSSDEHYIFNR